MKMDNTMIRCIIGDDQEKIHEFQQMRSEQNIVYTLEVIAEVVYVLSLQITIWILWIMYCWRITRFKGLRFIAMTVN